MRVHDEVKSEVKTGSYYQFDSYTLDPLQRTLRCGDKLIELTPKVFTTLLVLVENREKVLTKDELLTMIWPDQFVDQSNLSQNISVLRKSLGETETGKKYIATFPGRGYRFVGRVEIQRYGVGDRAATFIHPASSGIDDFPAASTSPGIAAPPQQPTRLGRNLKAVDIIAISVIILVVIAAFAIGRAIRNSTFGSMPADIASVKTYARMDAALTQPAWSRDGNAIAFVAMDLNGVDSAIYVQSKGDIQPRRVLSDAGQFSSPAWSPDGAQLAFLHFTPGAAELVIFNLQSKSSRVLTKLFATRYGLNYRHLDWSPDGKFIVVDDKTQDSEPFSLYLIYIDSGQRVRLTYPDSDMIGDVAPRVSPDSISVAFIRDIDPLEQDVYTTSVRGRTYQRITASHTLISDVGWKTNKLLALAADYGDGFKLRQVDLASRDQQAMAQQINSDRALQFSIKQNGQSVAFSNYSPNLDIWSTDTAHPSDHWVPIIQAPGENIRPLLSPDGKLLAFLSNTTGKFQIWTSQPDGGNASVVPTGTLVPASFCWSSDGKSLIFSPQSVHGLYEVPLYGAGPIRQLSPIYTDPYYAADGKSLFARAHFFLYRVPLAGGAPREVTEQGGAPIAQSRDGRYLYFSLGRMSTAISRLDLQTGHQDELINSLEPGYPDMWSLSPQGIFFLGREHDRPAVSFFNFANGSEQGIAGFPGELPAVGLSGFAASPDGKRLWVVRADQMPSDIEVTALPSN